MQFAVSGVDRPVSSWQIDSENGVHARGLREAEQFVVPEINNRIVLRDPPYSREDAEREESGKDMLENMDLLRSKMPEYDDLVDQTRGACNADLPKESWRERPTPSVNTLDMSVNTIEIVKKDGRYSIVMDGVSHGDILPLTDGSFPTSRYWMPRFHETHSKKHSEGGDITHTRYVQPVVVSLRLEDFETPPEKCELSVRQRVVNQGTVIMNNREIQNKEVIPYSTGDSSMNVVVLPYPIISTPPPYFVINDYSRLLHFEILAKFASNKVYFKSVWSAIKATGGLVAAPFTQSPLTTAKKVVGWSLYASLVATLKVLERIPNLAVAAAGYVAGEAATGAVQAAAQAAAGAASGAAASVSTVAGDAVQTFLETQLPLLVNDELAVTGGLAFGVFAFGAWEMLRWAPRVSNWMSGWENNRDFFSEDEIAVINNSHAAQSIEPPNRHKVTITMLPKMLRRISETRANGSLVQGTDQTVGLSVHSLSDRGWNAEAAFLHWLMYGEGDRKEADPVTGIYPQDACIRHNLGITKKPNSTPLTLNTVDVSGMDPLTISNTRTQFSFVISILEKDGTKGPVIMIEATRMNGVDAGWISAGMDAVMDECRKETDCLELKLMAMPGVARWMRGHSTLVADTNNGQIIGDRFDFTVNQKLGVEFDDSPDGTSEKQVKNAVKNAKKKQDTAETELERATSNLVTKRSKLANLKEDALQAKKDADSRRKEANQDAQQRWKNKQKKLDDRLRALKLNAEERIRTSRNERLAKGLAPIDVVKEKNIQDTLDKNINKVEASRKSSRSGQDESLEERVRNINNSEREKLRRINDNIRKTEVDVMNADQRANRVARDVEAMKLRVKAAGTARVFANIFDYDATIQRIKNKILGDLYNDYSRKSVKSKLEDVRRDALYQGSYWRRVVGWPKPKGAVELGKVEKHLQRCNINVCSSLCIPTNSLDENNPMVLRFIDTYSPISVTRNNDSRRLASFVVPSPMTWKEVSSRPFEVLRTLPQIVNFSRDVVSTFGNLTILQPLMVDKSDFEDQPNAIASIEESRKALRRVTNLYDISNLIIAMQRCHTIQKYKYGPQWENHRAVFNLPFSTNAFPLDMVSTACVPSSQNVLRMLVAEESGGDTYKSIMHMVAGKNTDGVSRLLEDCGVDKNASGLVALSAFSEITTFHVIAHGTNYLGGAGFELQNVELVYDFIKQSRLSCRKIAEFILNTYAKDGSSVRKMSYDDAAFFCIPQMVYLRVALRRLGILKKDGLVANASNSTSRHHARRFAVALDRIASKSKLNIDALPFVCLQSVMASVPPAVRMIQGYEHSVVAHVSAGALSFERIVIGTSSLSSALSAKATAAVRVDIVCSRPVVVKAHEINPSMTRAVASRALASKTQYLWQRPSRRLSPAVLVHRLAKLRVNIDQDLKLQAAVNPVSFLGKNGSDLAYEIMLARMNRLGYTELARVNERYPTATYVIPFGLTAKGTVLDVAHTNFANHPVWMDSLAEACTWTLASDAESADLTVHVAQLGFHPGHSPNPYMVQVGRSWVGVDIEPQKSVVLDEGYAREYAYDSSGSESMFDICEDVKMAGRLSMLSGDLSNRYRVAMSNCERLFQACLIIASKVHVAADVKDLAAQVKIPDDAHTTIFVACMCIANAMALSETGSSARVITKSDAGGQGDTVAKALKKLAASMAARGIVAVPFIEICMMVAAL